MLGTCYVYSEARDVRLVLQPYWRSNPTYFLLSLHSMKFFTVLAWTRQHLFHENSTPSLVKMGLRNSYVIFATLSQKHTFFVYKQHIYTDLTILNHELKLWSILKHHILLTIVECRWIQFTVTTHFSLYCTTLVAVILGATVQWMN